MSRRIGETTHHLFATPSYLDARGRPRVLAGPARHDAILLRSGVDRWELTGPRGDESVQVTGVVAADHLGFVVDATLAGLSRGALVRLPGGVPVWGMQRACPALNGPVALD